MHNGERSDMADTLAFEGIGSLGGKIRQGAVSPVALTEELRASRDRVKELEDEVDAAGSA